MLAIISMNTILGENGIVQKANISVEKQRAGSILEEIEIWNGEKMIEKHHGEKARPRSEVLDNLESRGLITEQERTQIETTDEVEIGNWKIVIKEGFEDIP